MGKEDVGKVLF